MATINPTTPVPAWQTASAKKRASLFSLIPSDWRIPTDLATTCSASSRAGVLHVPSELGILTDAEKGLTGAPSVAGLLGRMGRGKCRAYDVVLAFCKRAAIAHQLTNCLTEIFFDAALARAKELDVHFAETGKLIGPLHGIPLSLKDSFNVAGVQTTLGLCGWADAVPATDDSALVTLLTDLGAVVYVKTNIPQTMMTADTDNPLFGRTLNPRRLCLTAGGSTGGEGALLALKGSVLGVGTDIAGSVRIPALCNGIYGFKPSSSRVPFKGKTPPGRFGSPSPILPTIGIQGHSVADMEYWLASVLSASPYRYDAAVLNVPWRTVTTPTEPLRIGVLLEDPSSKLPLHPPMQRCLQSAAMKLALAGHSVKSLGGAGPTSVPSLYDVAVLAWKFFLLDPARTAAQRVLASGEPWVPSIAATTFPELREYTPSLDALFDMNVQRREYVDAFAGLVREGDFDVILLPAYQATAVAHDTYGVPVYTVLANVLDWPAGVLPFGQADKARDGEYVRRGVQYVPAYEPNLVEGMPTAVQVMGKPMMDEELLKIMAVIDEVLKRAD